MRARASRRLRGRARVALGHPGVPRTRSPSRGASHRLFRPYTLLACLGSLFLHPLVTVCLKTVRAARIMGLGEHGDRTTDDPDRTLLRGEEPTDPRAGT